MIWQGELRLGNIVADKQGIYRIVTGVRKDNFIQVDLLEGSRYRNGFLTFLQNMKPVPITFEILAKCDFKRAESGVYRRVCASVKEIVGTLEFTGSDWFLMTPDSGRIKLNIMSLHQLQNFYYALTGHDLVLEL